jgi:hypothetical protein
VAETRSLLVAAEGLPRIKNIKDCEDDIAKRKKICKKCHQREAEYLFCVCDCLAGCSVCLSIALRREASLAPELRRGILCFSCQIPHEKSNIIKI